MNGVLSSMLISTINQLLFSWFGVVLGVITAAGLSLVALYFANARFRYAYNLFMGPSGRQVQYGYRKGQKGLQVTRSGYAFDEEEGRWRYVQGKSYSLRSYQGSRYGRTYTKYHRKDD